MCPNHETTRIERRLLSLFAYKLKFSGIVGVKSHTYIESLITLLNMSLVSGPGRGGSAQLPGELVLCIGKHVKYIQSLDTVSRASEACLLHRGLTGDSEKMSLNTG